MSQNDDNGSAPQWGGPQFPAGSPSSPEVPQAPAPYGADPAAAQPQQPQPQQPWGVDPSAQQPAPQQPYGDPAAQFGQQPAAQQPDPQQPWGADPAAQQPYGQQPAPQQPWGGEPAAQQPFGQQPFGDDSTVAMPYGQQPTPPPYGADPAAQQYGQQPAPAPYSADPASQPYGQQGAAAFGAVGGQQPAYGGPGGPGYPGGPGGPGAPKKPLNKGLVFGGIGAAVVVIGGIIAAIVLGGGGGDDPTADDPTSGSDSSSSAAPATDRSPQGTVEGFFAAIMEGDSAAALTFVDTNGMSKTYITDDIIKASNELAPITDLVVSEPDPTTLSDYSADVPVSYMLGDVPVSVTYSLSSKTNGDFEVRNATSSIYLGGTFDGAEVLLNGQPVTTEDIEVLFGAYQLSTNDPNLTLIGAEELLLATEPYESLSTSAISVAVSETGKVAFHEAVNAAVTACIASVNFVAGCGIDITGNLSDGTVLTDGTIIRTLSSDATLALTNLNPTPAYGNAQHVDGDSIGALNVTAPCPSDPHARCELYSSDGGYIGRPTVDFSVSPPAALWD